MLASFEAARSSLIQAAERNRIATPQVHVLPDEDADERDASAAA
jgi:hypothetical protein